MQRNVERNENNALHCIPDRMLNRIKLAWHNDESGLPGISNDLLFA